MKRIFVFLICLLLVGCSNEKNDIDKTQDKDSIVEQVKEELKQEYEEKNCIIADNYIGKNYIEIMNNLKEYGITTYIEKKNVENKDDYEENVVFYQSINNGEKICRNDSIELYIPDLYK